jgi:hypothetical protein
VEENFTLGCDFAVALGEALEGFSRRVVLRPGVIGPFELWTAFFVCNATKCVSLMDFSQLTMQQGDIIYLQKCQDRAVRF